uniref:Type-1 angiotensin II receptor-associated protein-like n=1 Tax=Phallusia mammillata TaxID=59560 RepID=A0A6F9D6P8_9ASCI|nr:type-1 angiotensin II receptor-associated protein-like [Phallusia mammillata]
MPSISIKAIFVVHWCLFVWAELAWAGGAYTWCNLTALAIGIWAIADRHSVDAILLFMLMFIWSCLVDIVSLALYFPGSHSGSSPKFSAAMAIINLILKPVSIILLFQMYRDRGGEYNINFGPNTPSYDNMDGNDTSDDRGSTAFLKPPVVSQNTA